MKRSGSVMRLLSALLMVPLAALLANAGAEALGAVHGLRAADRVVALAEVDRALLQAHGLRFSPGFESCA